MAKSPDHLRVALQDAAGKPAPEAVSKPDSPASQPYERPSRQGKVAVTGFFDPSVRRQLKVMAAEGDTTVQALLTEALNDVFAKHGKPEVAE